MKDLVEQITAIAEFRPFESRMLDFRRRYADVVYDLRDPTQERQARSDRFQIGKVIGELDRSHKAIKAPLQKQVTLIDGESKRIKDDLLAIQGRIKAQIAARHDEIRLAAEKVQKAIDEIVASTEFPDRADGKIYASDVGTRLHHVTLNIDPESDIYGPRKAKRREEEEAEKLRKSIEKLRKREIIEANERAKREAHHAAECAARKERERIKQEQREAQQKAEADRKAAEKKAANGVTEWSDKMKLSADLKEYIKAKDDNFGWLTKYEKGLDLSYPRLAAHYESLLQEALALIPPCILVDKD